MREETEFRPKPLVEIGQRPILWHIMKLYAHHGYREFVLCLGYRGAMIREYFLHYAAMNSDVSIGLGSRNNIVYHGAHDEQDFQVTLVETGLDTMTAGRVKRIERYVDGSTFMVTYGDGLSDLDIARLMAFHRRHGKLATVTAVQPPSRYGVLDLDGNRVRKFAEKPTLEGWVNAGFFVFERRVFDYLDGDECVLEREPLERLCAEGQLMVFRHAGFFFPMDTYREYKLLNDLWERDEASWKVWAR